MHPIVARRSFLKNEVYAIENCYSGSRSGEVGGVDRTLTQEAPGTSPNYKPLYRLMMPNLSWQSTAATGAGSRNCISSDHLAGYESNRPQPKSGNDDKKGPD